MRPSPLRSLLFLAACAGLIQVAAGILMYLVGVYFAPWSMGVSIVVLLACILVGVARHRASALGGTMTFGQATGAGAAIAIGNLIRLTVGGTVLALITAPLQRRTS